MVASRIKERRLAAGFRTTSEAAERAGIKWPAYKHYENGTRLPALLIIKNLGDLFNSNPAYLVGWTDDPTPVSG